MDYISAEEFLKQPEEVQKVFLDWWKPEIGDFAQIVENEPEIIIGFDTPPFYKTLSFSNMSLRYASDNLMVPLFTERQLRHFIEDKTKCKIDIVYLNNTEFQFSFWKYDHGNELYDSIEIKAADLLQAYWQVACKIAGEEK